MTDLHTHILPGIDDGSKDVETSIAMLKMQKAQGTDTIVLTPHCYRDKETPESFLQRRAAAFERLQQGIVQQSEALPRLRLAAEVAWAPHLEEWSELPQLCIQDTSYLLLEMPFCTWNDQMIYQIYDMMDSRGITPVFAHLERYVKDQRKEYIDEILSMGVPIQISAEPMLHTFGKRTLIKWMKNHQAHVMASDCHNLTSRAPNLAAGLEAVKKALGQETMERLIDNADRIVAGEPFIA